MATSGKKSPVVFFGTGPVAAASLTLLVKHQQVEAVVTKPKPPGHKGEFPVTETANALGLKIIEVSSKQEVYDGLVKSNLSSSLGILIDFGIIVSEETIRHFPLGIVNSHFSRLPQWRGADPITFAILSGQKTTAVSLMLVDKGMDTGKIIAQKGITIDGEDTTPSLTDKLIKLSDDLLRDCLPRYCNQQIKPRSQPHPERATYSRKLTKQDGAIDWEKPAAIIEREIRAFIEWPKSYSKIANKDVVITSSRVSRYTGRPGAVVINNDELHICCGVDSLEVLKLKPASKKEMTSRAFLAGHRTLIEQ